MSDHTQLRVWRRSQQLTVDVAKSLSPMISRRMPGLRAQLLRALASVGANIAEGSARATSAQYAHFLSIAIASATEAESHLSLAMALEVVLGDTQALVIELKSIRAMIFKLRQYIEAR